MTDSAVDRMLAQTRAWEAGGDGRAIFLDCYGRMTAAVEAAATGGRFADPDWVGRLLDRFAEYYFVTIDDAGDAAGGCGDGGGPVPEPWVLAHRAARDRSAAPLQLLLAGVNAHINYDLVLTLVDLLDPEWEALDATGRAARRRDYDLINAVIAETADLVQDAVVERYSPGLDVADRLLGRWDERVAVRLLTGWRTRVWRHAGAVLADPDADGRRARVAAIERQCARRARWLLL